MSTMLWGTPSRKSRFSYPSELAAAFERVTGSKPLRGVKLLTGEATTFVRSRFSRTEETAVRQLRAVVAGVLGVEAAAVSSLMGSRLLLSFWQLHKKAPEVVAAEMARLNIDYDTDLEETSEEDEEDTEDIEDETPIAGGVEDAHRTASAGRGTGLRPPGVPHARPVSRSRSPPITPPPVDNAIIALIERMEKDRKAEMAELRAEIAQLKKAPPAPRATPDAAQSRANSQASENGDALPSVRGGESDYSEGGISVDAPRETVLLDPAFWVNMDRTEKAVLLMELRLHFVVPLTKAPHESGFLLGQLAELLTGVGTSSPEQDEFAVRLARNVIVRLLVLKTGYEVSWDGAQAVSDTFFGAPKVPDYLKKSMDVADTFRKKKPKPETTTTTTRANQEGKGPFRPREKGAKTGSKTAANSGR
ncbi:hypothetical protein DIPPA_14425 [Diplonema papillatum]|nr:hypothetical protein DIPPA_35431 [Diplonema papillatum]KAJ9472091.1 hypothetical protein DIPPA_14425 [Diplonema papillatum]